MDLRVSKSLLLSKAKSMVSSLSGIILWSTGSPLLSPALPNPKPFSSLQQDHILGLKTLICTEPETTHHSHYTSRVLSRPSSPPQQPKTTPFPREYPSHSSATMDDLIGTDSGVHMVPTGSGDDQTATGDEKRRPCCTNSRIRDKRRRHEALEHYPPAMPSAAATKLQGINYSSGLLGAPWAWTRHCRDGKLVLEGRLLARHEYLEARREDGRLILNLVSIGAEDHIGGGDDDHASEEMIIDRDGCDDEERLGGLCLESGTTTTTTYGCGMFVDPILLCNASNNVPNSLPALVRPMTG